MARDVDIAVDVVDDQAAEAVVHALVQTGYVLDNVLEQSAAGRLATTRLLPPGLAGTGLVVDLLFASSGIEAEVVDAAEPLSLLKDTIAPRRHHWSPHRSEATVGGAPSLTCRQDVLP